MVAKVSLVLPNIEEEGIFQIIRDSRRLFGSGLEIIVVDRSSAGFVNRLRKTGVRIIRQRSKGVENAVMEGLREATGDILLSTDCDNTHETEGLRRAADLVRSGKADFVMGNRLNRLQKGAMGAYLRFGNRALSLMFSIIYMRRLHDVLSGLFAMDREAFESIRHVKPYRLGIAFFAAELAKRGYRLRDIDIKYYIREHGQSKLAKSKLLWGMRMAWLMLAKRFS
ncbi:MAG: glycosyltransferase family 2 protein [Candidatus Marsarchaeota archaeon]|nr:glycosyltransferase family 2 protein [Candidatus Marsarchaeota archaeon]